MTLNASLRNRVRRLEEVRSKGDCPSLAELLRRARERWHALTPQQQAAERCQSVARAVAALDQPEPVGDDLEARLRSAVRHRGLRHLAALASLEEPDLVEPSPFDVEAHAAWRHQQLNRVVGRRYLADVVLAGDLLKETP